MPEQFANMQIKKTTHKCGVYHEKILCSLINTKIILVLRNVLTDLRHRQKNSLIQNEP